MIEEKYQTFWRRFGAVGVDFIVLLPLFLIDLLMVRDSGSFPPLFLLIWYAAYRILDGGYSVFMHARYGQTIGKMATGVKVLDVSEKPLAVSQAFRRDIIPILLTAAHSWYEIPMILSGVNINDSNAAGTGPFYEFLPYAWLPWVLSEIVTMFLNQKRRAIHDYIAGSVVVRVPPRPVHSPASE